MRVIIWSIAIIALSTWLTGCASQIGKVNWQINKMEYCRDPEGKPDLKEISSHLCGDCDDFAYTKCKRLKAMGYKTSLLYRVGEPDDHIALEVDGWVLDNQYANTYKYNPGDWSHKVNWECE